MEAISASSAGEKYTTNSCKALESHSLHVPSLFYCCNMGIKMKEADYKLDGKTCSEAGFESRSK